MNVILPIKIFLTRGSGQHTEKLVRFEIALREAGINPFNRPGHLTYRSRGFGFRILM